MRGRIGFVVIAVLVLAGVGWYRGWYRVSTDNSSTTRQVHVGVTVDKAKLKADSAKVKEAVEDLGSKARDKARDVGDAVESKTSKDATLAATSSREVAGLVTRVSPADGMLAIKTDTAGELALLVPTSAPVTRDGMPASLAQVVAGDRVRVALENDATAVSITVEPS